MGTMRLNDVVAEIVGGATGKLGVTPEVPS